jgi:hypothetical protein
LQGFSRVYWPLVPFTDNHLYISVTRVNRIDIGRA